MPQDAPAPVLVVVAGVASAGKTTLGRALAEDLGIPFVEGDDLHRPEDIERMRQGRPLGEEPRMRWLDRIAERIRAVPSGIVTCSALGRAHRDRLRAARPDVRFLVLVAPRDELVRRAGRRDHFFAAALLDDQLDRFEQPDDERDAIVLEADRPVAELVTRARVALGLP